MQPPHDLWPIKIFSMDYWSPSHISCLILVLIGFLSLCLLFRVINRLFFKDPDSDAPLDKAGFFSLATFWWVVNPTLRIGQTRTLQIEDLPKLAAADQPEKLNARFSKFRITENFSAWMLMFRVMYSIQPGVFLWSFFSGWLFLGAMFLDPILLRLLLTSSSVNSSSSWTEDLAYHLGLVLLLSLSMLVRVTFMEQVLSDSAESAC